MFCHNCGKQSPDGVNFCGFCGASQAIVNSFVADRANTPPSAQSPEYHISYVN